MTPFARFGPGPLRQTLVESGYVFPVAAKHAEIRHRCDRITSPGTAEPQLGLFLRALDPARRRKAQPTSVLAVWATPRQAPTAHNIRPPLHAGQAPVLRGGASLVKGLGRVRSVIGMLRPAKPHPWDRRAPSRPLPWRSWRRRKTRCTTASVLQALKPGRYPRPDRRSTSARRRRRAPASAGRGWPRPGTVPGRRDRSGSLAPWP